MLSGIEDKQSKYSEPLRETVHTTASLENWTSRGSKKKKKILEVSGVR